MEGRCMGDKMSNKVKKEIAKSNSKETKNAKVSPRKYVNCVLMMIAIVLVVFIACKMYNRYQDNKLGESVFTRFVGTIHYDDIDNAINEMTEDGFILISYVRSEDVKRFETELKKAISDHELQNNFYYLDATDLMLEDGYIDSLNEKFGLEGYNEIELLPAILYFADGTHKKTISSTEARMLSVDDFNKMLDSYEIIETK